MAGLKQQRAIDLAKKAAKKHAQEAKSRGLGDTIARGLSMMGITPELVEKIKGKPCKCRDRQTFLNKLFPYKKKEKLDIVEEPPQ